MTNFFYYSNLICLNKLTTENFSHWNDSHKFHLEILTHNGHPFVLMFVRVVNKYQFASVDSVGSLIHF